VLAPDEVSIIDKFFKFAVPSMVTDAPVSRYIPTDAVEAVPSYRYIIGFAVACMIAAFALNPTNAPVVGVIKAAVIPLADVGAICSKPPQVPNVEITC
jgi:hypothetical protein